MAYLRSHIGPTQYRAEQDLNPVLPDDVLGSPPAADLRVQSEPWRRGPVDLAHLSLTSPCPLGMVVAYSSALAHSSQFAPLGP